MAITRHLQHQKTSSLEYVMVLKADIPVNEAVYREYTSIPTIDELAGIETPYKYIFVTNRYYKLSGKRPTADHVKYGEVAISFAKGNEMMSIKNSANEIVEFHPYSEDKLCVKKYQETNPELQSTNGTCTWKINYSTLADNKISTDGAVVFLREISTGKQTVPDVTFNNTGQCVEISIYSKSTISARKYLAIIIGTSYVVS